MDELLKKYVPQIRNVPAQQLLSLLETTPSELVPKVVFGTIPELNGSLKNLNILVGSTGSVATIKLPEILAQLNNSINNVNLQVVLTEKAKHFCAVAPENVPRMSIYSDSEWNIGEAPFLPDELAVQANMLLIAPLDANTLAKIANGFCDNLLTSIVRLWDFNKKIAVCCPAMNTQMWVHPITDVHMKQLESLGFIIIPPIIKKLACGDYGVGAMAEPASIVSKIKHFAKFNGNKLFYDAYIGIQENSVEEIAKISSCNSND